jgi:hypothetical protein
MSEVSNEEQDAAEGRLRRESRDAKRRLAALTSELADKIHHLRKLTGHLEAIEKNPEDADDPLRRGELEMLLGKLPDAAKLRDLLQDLKQEQERSMKLGRQISQFE